MSPNVNDLKNSKFLAKEDVMPDVLVTIERYEQVDVSMDDQPEQIKYILHFKELEKPMVLNKTNGMLIAKITGSEEFDDWIGRKVVLYNDTSVMFAGEFTGGIRVRPDKRTEQAPPAEDTTDHSEGDPDDVPF